MRGLWAPGLGSEGGEGSAGSCGLITCSADQSVGLYCWQPRQGGKGLEEGAAAGGDAGEELSGSLVEIKRVSLTVGVGVSLTVRVGVSLTVGVGVSLTVGVVRCSAGADCRCAVLLRINRDDCLPHLHQIQIYPPHYARPISPWDHLIPPAAAMQVPYAAPVQDVLLLQDGRTLVVALKATNNLRLLDMRRLQVGGGRGGRGGRSGRGGRV